MLVIQTPASCPTTRRGDPVVNIPVIVMTVNKYILQSIKPAHFNGLVPVPVLVVYTQVYV